MSAPNYSHKLRKQIDIRRDGKLPDQTAIPKFGV